MNREEALTLDDIDLRGGQLGLSTTGEPSHVLMGRYGDTMLVNGKTD